MERDEKKLGGRQRACLKSLRKMHGWQPGCGWYWDNAAETVRILDSLVRKGFASRCDRTSPDGRTIPTFKPVP